MLAAKPRQAVILVGGCGTRLGALAAKTPKPMLEVAGRPFVELLLDQAANEGVERIVLACAHLAEQVVAEYSGRSWASATVACHVEDAPSGTAGALLSLQDELEETFFVLNGDSLLHAPWGPIAAGLEDPATAAALGLVHVESADRYGAIDVDDRGKIVAFREKGSAGAGLVNAGVYAMRRSALASAGDPPLSLEHDVFPALAARGSLTGVRCDGWFIDIGVPADLERARTELASFSQAAG